MMPWDNSLLWDVEDFPIELQWYAVRLMGKQPTIVAKTFLCTCTKQLIPLVIYPAASQGLRVPAHS